MRKVNVLIVYAQILQYTQFSCDERTDSVQRSDKGKHFTKDILKNLINI